MKTSSFPPRLITIILLICLISCHTPSQFISNSLDTNILQNNNLNKTDSGYKIDLGRFQKKMSNKLDSINQSIELYKVRIEDNNSNAGYLNKIQAIEQKNTNLKNELNNYKADGIEKWKMFKNKIIRNMDDVNSEFKQLVITKSDAP